MMPKGDYFLPNSVERLNISSLLGTTLKASSIYLFP